MARILERPYTFFRVSPVEIGKVKCFAVRRGEIAGRCDAKYFILREMTSRAHYGRATLGSLVRVEPDYGSGARAVSRKSETDPRYIRITDFGADGIEPGHEYVTASIIEPKYELAAHDILFARSGATVGKTYIHEDTSERAIFGGYCIRFRFDLEKVFPQFVYWITKTETYARWVAAIQRPSGQPNINKEEFKQLEIPLPDRAKQSKVIASMDAARAARQAKLAEADTILGSLDAWILEQIGLRFTSQDTPNAYALRLADIKRFARIDPLFHSPKHRVAMALLAHCTHPVISLDTLCEKPLGGATPRRGDQELYAEDGIRFLRILNIKPNHVDLSDVKFINETVDSGMLKRSQLAENDVLMTITGRVGTAAVVHSNILPANINQLIVRLRVRDNDCLPEYLAAYLNTSLGLALSNRGVSGGTRVALDYGAIRSLPVPLPPLTVQEAIVSKLRCIRDESRRLHIEAEAEWQEAKRWFEEQLLGPPQP